MQAGAVVVKLAWIGTYGFHHAMPAQGFETAFVRIKEPCAMDWDDVCRAAGFTPDVLVYSDRSFPLPLTGVEEYPCLTCFYVVDSHIHASWYPAYRTAFDCCAVSLRDHIPAFEDAQLPDATIWLPPYPRQRDVPIPDAKPKWDVLFVGNVDAETTPRRAVFLEELDRLIPGSLHVTTGDYHELYPYARVVLNIAERDDLNFRVFEAMACGACLLTPHVAHGQDDLFTPGVHFEEYANLDAADAANRIRALLDDQEKRQAMGRAAAEAIEQAHRKRHRAAELARLLGSDAARQAHERRMAQADRLTSDLRLLYLHWADVTEDETMRAKYLAAATGRPAH